MKIYVKTLDNFIMTFEVQPSDSVEKLKLQIEKTIGLPRYGQRLVYRGKVLFDERTLSDFDVENESSIHLNHRVHNTNPHQAT
jgi:hypothetical protein